MPLRRFAVAYRATDAVRHALADWRAHDRVSSQAARDAWLRTEPDLARWQGWLTQALLILGVSLIAAGVIVFFAFNWQQMHRFARFALVAVLLAACVALAWPRRAGDLVAQVLIWAAQLLTGAALAVIGQAYQSGADAWQLFAWWAALAVPWALAGRAAPHWWMVVLLANAALLRWFGVRLGAQTPFDLLFGVAGSERAAVSLLAAAAVQLTVWQLLQLRLPRIGIHGMTGVRALAVLVCAYASWLGLGALLSREFEPAMLAIALLAPIALGWSYLPPRLDLFVLSVATLAGIVLVVAAVGRLVAEANTGFGIFLLLGVLTVVLSAAAATWLMRLHRRQAILTAARASAHEEAAIRHRDSGNEANTGSRVRTADEGEADSEGAVADATRRLWAQLAEHGAVRGELPSPVRAPLAIRLLTGTAGWLGGLFFQVFLIGAVFVAARDSGEVMVACGLCLVALAVLLARRHAHRAGVEQFALATSLMGQALTIYGAADLLGGDHAVETPTFWLAVAGFQVLLYALLPIRLHRLLSALGASIASVAALAVAIALGEPDRWQGVAWALALFCPIASLLAMAFALAEARCCVAGRHPAIEPAADGLLIAALGSALMLTGMSHPLGMLFEPGQPLGVANWIAGLVLGLWLIGLGWRETRRLRLARAKRLRVATITAALTVLLAGAPAVVAGLLALGLALRRCGVAWLGYALPTIVLGFLWYYSAMHWTLAIKAATLLAAGAAALLGWHWLTRRGQAAAPAVKLERAR